MAIRFDRKSLIRWKVYVDRARMYIGYAQFLMIGLVFLDRFKGTPTGDLIFEYSLISIPVLFFMFIIFSLILGFFDSKLGLREEEIRNHASSNPVLRDIQKDIREIKQKLGELETQEKPKK